MVTHMRGVSALWREMETLPAGMELLTCVLMCLDAGSVLGLMCVEKRSRESVVKVFYKWYTARARLALASLCFSRLRVDFQAHYQELETHNIPRSSDPRVPPRVVSIWTERGQVDGGSVTLKPVELPSVHKDGLTARFDADAEAAGKRPMLSNVVQRNRRIYTMVTVKLLKSPGDNEDNSGGTVVLRSYSYLKEFGEWKTPTLPEKRMLAAASIGSRRGRFDLCSQDGSVVLELEVPLGADAQTDYYLVKQAVVSIHMQELLQLHFHSLRPIQALPELSRREPCTISLAFRSMTGSLVARCCAAGYITVERQDGGESDASGDGSNEDRRRQRTGVEKFEVVTCRVDGSTARSIKLSLPNDPGYVWLEVRSASDASSSRRSTLYFYAVALHYGARQVPENSELRALQLNWLPGVLESFPTLESRQRRCLKGNLRMVTSSYAGSLQELTLVAQRLPAARLERYAARIESYTRYEV